MPAHRGGAALAAALGLLFAVAPGPAHAGPPEIVKEINTGTNGSNPGSFASLGGTTYFNADGGLWRTDGTAAGTEMVVPGLGPSQFVEVGGTVFFRGGSGSGAELWKTDGTAAGTEMVKDIRPGGAGSYPGALTDLGGTLVFVADDNTHGYELWKSDGTEAGTQMVKDVNPGSADGASHLVALNGAALFRGTDGDGTELWKTDGTAAGTAQVEDIYPGSSSSGPWELTRVGGAIFFGADDGTNGDELWKSDGTAAGTQLVEDIRSGSTGSGPGQLVNVDGTLMFRAYDGVNPSLSLWKSNGTAAGTQHVGGPSGIYNLTALGSTVYFRDCAGGLWKSDGTGSGTELVKDIAPSCSGPNDITSVGGMIFFTINDGTNGDELWVSDGTTAGTVLAKDIRPGDASSSPTSLTDIGGSLFFSANDGAHGHEFWTSDGTGPGTEMLADLDTSSAASSPEQLTRVGGTTFFVANDGVHGQELWKTDGTAAGTELVKDVRPGYQSSNPQHLANVGGTLFLSANDGTNGQELWKSDGTEAGTEIVKDIDPRVHCCGGYGSDPRQLTNVGGTLFFNAEDDNNLGRELWKSDGTEAGTVLVKDIWPGAGDSGPWNLTNVAGTLFFRANESTTGLELWKSDGTEAGTVLVKDIRPGSQNSTPGNFTDVNGTLFLSANDGTHGGELWKSDGTEAGTVMVKDIDPVSSRSSSPGSLTAFDGTLLFSATPAYSWVGHRLWKSDGTEAGTEVVKEIRGDGSSPSHLTRVGDTVFFRARDDDNDIELWKTDGTEAGTERVKDIRPGTSGSFPQGLAAVGGSLFFSADDGTNGRELWSSDGTEAATMLVDDIAPGAASSNIDEITDGGGVALFEARGLPDGAELWRYTGDTTPPAEPTFTATDPASPANDNTPKVSGDAEDGSTVDLFDNAACTGPPLATGTAADFDDPGIEATVTDDTTTTFHATATDAASNTSDCSTDSIDYTEDSTPPAEPTFTGTDPASPANDNTPLVQGAANSTVDLYTTADCSGAPNATGDSADFSAAGIEATVADDSTTTFKATATDAAGNTSACSDDSVTYVEDSTAPTSSIDSGPAEGSSTKDDTPEIAFSSGDPSADLECSLDGAGFAPCASPLELGPLSNAEHTLEVRATDEAGNQGAAVSRTFTVIPPELSIDDVSVDEGDSGQADATFSVSLDAAIGKAASVDLDTADDTATEPADYEAKSTTVDFPAGDTSKQVTVKVEGDTLDEVDETFTAELSNPTNATIDDGTGVGTITDDDDPPALSIDNVTVDEGDTGTTDATFTISLDSASGKTVGVDFATADDSATEPADYEANNGTATFAAGETSKQVTVKVAGDTLDEPNETFTVELSNPTGAGIADGTGTGTITDDDAPQKLSIDDVTVTEGDAGQVDATFTVSLDAASGKQVDVDFATADDSATEPADYEESSGSRTFAPGETSKQVTVKVEGDTLDEADETFTVELSNASGATIDDASGQGTITDDDDPPALSIDNVTVNEGDAGTTNATFTVSLDVPSGRQVTVDHASSDGTATEPVDYAPENGTTSFDPGQISKQVTVEVTGDRIEEPDEGFEVGLSNPANATIADATGEGTIRNDDPTPEISIDDVAVDEGDSGQSPATFTVSLSNPTHNPVGVELETADGTATEPDDYEAKAKTVDFAPGEETQTVNVQVQGDELDEPDEEFTAELSTPTNATIADDTGTATIADDDDPPSLAIDDVTVDEGDSGTTDATFTVTLDAPSAKEVTVDLDTADGTATAPEDYEAKSASRSFASGETSKQLKVRVAGDSADEPDEAYEVKLSNAQKATIDDGTGTGTITDDDEPAQKPPDGPITGTPRDDVIEGTPGDDVIIGLAGNDVIKGKGGNDVIVGGEGDDVIGGGRGSDLIIGAGGDGSGASASHAAGASAAAGSDRDILRGGAGPDVIHGGPNRDIIRGKVGADRLLGGAGKDVLKGNAGTDELRGMVGKDVLKGGGGEDDLRGGGGHDQLFGGPGADLLAGAIGRDFLVGSGGDDVIRGGGGRDILRGGAGPDVIHGGPNRDIIRGKVGADRLLGGAGKDVLKGNAGTDELRGMVGKDVLKGGGGEDDLRGGGGHDQLFGGPGADLLAGAIGRDFLVGSGGDDVIRGGGGRDKARGGPGDDKLKGQAGSRDALRGQGGDDKLAGGGGARDRCHGGAGTDTAKRSCERVRRVP